MASRPGVGVGSPPRRKGCRVGSVEQTIRAAAEAYIAGDEESFSEQLHEDARVLGSEQLDYWSNREEAMEGLGAELVRRQATIGTVAGSLIDQVVECEGVNEIGVSRCGRPLAI